MRAAHFETAMQQAEELPFKKEQPEARRFYAEMLLDRDGPGDRDRVRVLLEEAVAGYEELGFPRHRELAEALLRRCEG